MANKTGKGGFADNPQNRNQNGQLNPQAVAFKKTLRELIIAEGIKEHTDTVGGESVARANVDWMIQALWAKARHAEQWACEYIRDQIGERPQNTWSSENEQNYAQYLALLNEFVKK